MDLLEKTHILIVSYCKVCMFIFYATSNTDYS